MIMEFYSCKSFLIVVCCICGILQFLVYKNNTEENNYMPIELKKYFWNTNFEKLNKEKNKRYIISRLYCYGNLRVIKWIRDNYTNKDIEDVARNSRNLKPLVANYLMQQFNLHKEEMAYYRWVNSMNYEYWKISK